MNFRIIKLGAMTRREMLRSFFRWLLYVVLLVLAFAIQCTMPFFEWQPLLVVSIACAVAMFEGELSGVIFGTVAGMLQDIATGGLFGFTSIWLVPCCMFVTLLVVNLIHRNLINFMWMNFSALLIVEFFELLFKHIIWRNPDIDIIILNFMIPSVVSTVLASFIIYGIVKLLNKKLGNEVDETKFRSGIFNDSDSDDEIRV